MPNISILDDAKQPTTNYVMGRPLVRIQVCINGTVVIPNGYGLVDTGARTSMVHAQAVGDNSPDVVVPTVHGGGHGTTGMFSNCGVKIEGLIEVPVQLSLVTGSYNFDVLIGRDILQHCRLVMDYTTGTFTIDMR